MSKRIIIIGSIASALLLDAFTATVMSANAHRRGSIAQMDAPKIEATATHASPLAQDTAYYSHYGEPLRRVAHRTVRPPVVATLSQQ